MEKYRQVLVVYKSEYELIRQSARVYGRIATKGGISFIDGSDNAFPMFIIL